MPPHNKLDDKKFSSARFQRWDVKYLDQPLPKPSMAKSAPKGGDRSMPVVLIVFISVISSFTLNLLVLSTPRNFLTNSVGLNLFDRYLWNVMDQRVEARLLRYSKDGIGKRDFASVHGGAEVITSVTSATYKSGGGHANPSPEMALRPGVLHDKCWPTALRAGGRLGVSLAAPVIISDITIDHIAAELANNITKAEHEYRILAGRMSLDP
ncbi:hypothetical protein BD410DRAFT_844809 [Rickenella mellea]|uniref:SUN domain-containing protein n=1 Tax=Rickenella mellea TaxID=50990 RepID=A0A4Y7PKA7_9AGAM|nr:hypothetical protein BD410DRAFT_844809 [Rickenella mellea]